MPNMPSQYYSRFDEAKHYDEHLFIAGRGLQSAELNEIQKQASARLKNVADALFKDGDVIRDARVVVSLDTGDVTCQSGAIYLRGAVRGVPPATLNVAAIGTFAIGIQLVESVITTLEDPALRDPATGTRNYDEPGADRLEVNPVWAIGTDGITNFYPVYSVTDRVLDAKEPPPNLDAVTQALARYDRDSAGGSYVVNGLEVKKLDDADGQQIYNLSEGRCRVFGYAFEFTVSRRLKYPATPDLRTITNEPHLSSTASAQRINLDRVPATNITQVNITAERTVTLTHAIVAGSQDPLPDTSVISVLEVKQGATTYVKDTDYVFTAGKIDWSPAGAEPAPGSSYTVKYQYIAVVTPTAVDDNGFTVTGAVAGTLVTVDYQQKLPRVDRLCVNSDGQLVWVKGVAADYSPQSPAVPEGMLGLASVAQTWTSARTVTNDGVRVVPMPQLAAVNDRLDWLAQLIAQNRLESSINTRESGTKIGLFTDPFLDDSQRDAGIPQTAAIVNGELVLPVASSAHQMGSDITTPQALPYTSSVAMEQPLRTGSMQINPYMAFDPVPAAITLTPAVDRWTDIKTDWASPTTQRVTQYVSAADSIAYVTSTRDALLSKSSSDEETLRQITINFEINGFGAGEALSSITFDGVSLPTGGAVADSAGKVVGSFTIPSGVAAGSKLFVATGAGGGHGQTIFVGQGTIERQVWQKISTTTTILGGFVDPLAQTFTLPDSQQVSGIDLWFTAKPTSLASVQLRETSNGIPTQAILAEAVIKPADVNIGGATTRAQFPAPVSLLANTEYAIVVLCSDAVGAMSVAELGKFDANAQRWITSQPYTVGVLLSSSNASTWTAHQDRDLAFRVLKADFSATSRTIDLGNVAVSGVTDLLLLSFADRPDSATRVEYNLTMPDNSVIVADESQPIQLAAAVTGNINVSAILHGTAGFSPILYRGSQLISGIVGASGTYITRAVPGAASVTLKTIFEAIVPSGANVVVEYQIVGTSTWTTLPQTATRAVDDGFTEFTNSVASINAAAGVRFRLTLSGTTAARPRVRDLRAFVK